MLQIKALVGNRGSGVFHVFEMEQKLPKFAMYVPRPLDQAHNQRPDSSVVFQVCRAPFRSRRIGPDCPRSFVTGEQSAQEGKLPPLVDVIDMVVSAQAAQDEDEDEGQM